MYSALMKKILLGLGCLILAIIGAISSNFIASQSVEAATCPSGYTYMSASNTCVNISDGSTTSPTASAPGAFSSTLTCTKTDPDSIAQCKSDCKAVGGTPEACAKQFSCSTLFTDATTAAKCNYDRCKGVEGRLEDYCSCKYGVGGDPTKGKGIPLNTDLPFIGRCLGKSNGESGDTAALTAFPQILSVASRILVTVILLASFIMIIVGGVQWAGGDPKSGRKMISKVVIGLALLGMMGAILRIINPNFFK